MTSLVSLGSVASAGTAAESGLGRIPARPTSAGTLLDRQSKGSPRKVAHGADDCNSSLSSRGKCRARSSSLDRYGNGNPLAAWEDDDFSRLSSGALTALESSSLELEKQKLLRALDRQQRWLKCAADKELKRAESLEASRVRAEVEAAVRLEQLRQEEQRAREVNEFLKLQYERRRQELEQRREVERRVIAEKSRKLQETNSMRSKVLEHQKSVSQQSIKEAHEAREHRARRTSEQGHRQALEKRARLEQMTQQWNERLEKFAQQRVVQREESAELSNARDAKIKGVQGEAARLEEEKRRAVDQQVQQKQEKVATLSSARQHLWQIRRAAQVEVHRALESVKQEVHRQHVASRYNPGRLLQPVGQLQQKVDQLSLSGILSPRSPLSVGTHRGMEASAALAAAAAEADEQELRVATGRPHC